MFVCSLKASKVKIVLSIAVCAVIAAATLILIPDSEHTVSVNGMQYDKKISFDGMFSNEDIQKFVTNLGYTTDAEPTESAEVKLPSKFDAVMEKYNNLQKSQGFNLAKYKNKTVSRHTYLVKGLPDSRSLPDDEVFLTLIVYKDKIIGGDLYFTGKNSEVTAFLK